MCMTIKNVNVNVYAYGMYICDLWYSSATSLRGIRFLYTWRGKEKYFMQTNCILNLWCWKIEGFFICCLLFFPVSEFHSSYYGRFSTNRKIDEQISVWKDCFVGFFWSAENYNWKGMKEFLFLQYVIVDELLDWRKNFV